MCINSNLTRSLLLLLGVFLFLALSSGVRAFTPNMLTEFAKQHELQPSDIDLSDLSEDLEEVVRNFFFHEIPETRQLARNKLREIFATNPEQARQIRLALLEAFILFDREKVIGELLQPMDKQAFLKKPLTGTFRNISGDIVYVIENDVLTQRKDQYIGNRKPGSRQKVKIKGESKRITYSVGKYGYTFSFTPIAVDPKENKIYGEVQHRARYPGGHSTKFVVSVEPVIG